MGLRLVGCREPHQEFYQKQVPGLTWKGSKMITSKCIFDREKIGQSQDYEGHLMVSLEAEDKSFQRTPVNVVLVLDVSGSMSGRKLSLLKTTAGKIVQNLTNKDEVAIVTYASDVQVDISNQKIDGKESILSTIHSLQTRGMTNMSGGLLEGFSQVNAKFNGVQRVMLLTDGLANVGIQADNYEGFLNLVKNRDSKCTLSTFAFGGDADVELLQGMAKNGGGNFYYIRNEDIDDVFARELGGIASCLAQNIEISVSPSQGKVVEVFNDYNVEDKNGVAVIRADDIYVGETKHVLVKLKVDKPNGKPKNRPFSIAKVTITYDDLKTNKKERIEFNQRVRFVKDTDADQDAALAVAEQVASLIAAKAQVEAVKKANAGDWNGANLVMAGAAVELQSVVDRGSTYAAEVHCLHSGISDNLSADKYSASYGSTVRSAAVAYSRSKAGSGDEHTFSKLRKTKSQSMMEGAFKSDPTSTYDPDQFKPDLSKMPPLNPFPSCGPIPGTPVPGIPGNPRKDIPDDQKEKSVKDTKAFDTETFAKKKVRQ